MRRCPLLDTYTLYLLSSSIQARRSLQKSVSFGYGRVQKRRSSFFGFCRPSLPHSVMLFPPIHNTCRIPPPLQKGWSSFLNAPHVRYHCQRFASSRSQLIFSRGFTFVYTYRAAFPSTRKVGANSLRLTTLRTGEHFIVSWFSTHLAQGNILEFRLSSRRCEKNGENFGPRRLQEVFVDKSGRFVGWIGQSAEGNTFVFIWGGISP